MRNYLSAHNRRVRRSRAKERLFEILTANAEHLPGLAAVLIFGLIFVGLMFGMAD